MIQSYQTFLNEVKKSLPKKIDKSKVKKSKKFLTLDQAMSNFQKDPNPANWEKVERLMKGSSDDFFDDFEIDVRDVYEDDNSDTTQNNDQTGQANQSQSSNFSKYGYTPNVPPAKNIVDNDYQETKQVNFKDENQYNEEVQLEIKILGDVVSKVGQCAQVFMEIKNFLKDYDKISKDPIDQLFGQIENFQKTIENELITLTTPQGKQNGELSVQ